MMEIRCVISPASRKRFMLPSRGARAGAPWEAPGQGQVRSLRATTSVSSRRPPAPHALSPGAASRHQESAPGAGLPHALMPSADCWSPQGALLLARQILGSVAFVLVPIALNLA